MSVTRLLSIGNSEVSVNKASNSNGAGAALSGRFVRSVCQVGLSGRFVMGLVNRTGQTPRNRLAVRVTGSN
jgi:hypothetical protein